MKVEPRFRVGPFQVSGGSGMTLLIILVLLVCCVCGPIIQKVYG